MALSFNQSTAGKGGLAAAISPPKPVVPTIVDDAANKDTSSALKNTQIGPVVSPLTPTVDAGQIPFQDAENPLIVTSKNFQTGINNASSGLDSSLRNINPNYPYPAPPATPTTTTDTGSNNTADYSDGFTKQLDAIASSSNDSTKSLIASIHAARANQQGQLDTKYQQYERGLQLLGVEKGSAAATPELLSGQLIQAENQHQQKISDLVAKETKAVMDAQQARDDGNLKLMTEKMSYLQTIQKQKATALKDYYDTLTSSGKAADSVAASVSSKVMALDPSQREAYLTNVATQYQIPLDSLVSSVAAYQQSQSKADLEEENIRSQINNRGSESNEKALTPSALTSLSKQNPLIKLDYGTTASEAQQAVANASALSKAIVSDFSDPKSGAVVNGRYTYDYIKKALSNLPEGIDRIGFLSSIKGQLGLGKYKNAKNYGITQDEFDELTAE